MISIFISGFFGKRLYAMSPAKRLLAKLSIDRCLVCSIWHTFLSSSLTVSMTALFRSMILSYRFISEFFMFFLILVIRCMSSINNISKRSWLMYPLSANSFPKSRFVNVLFFKGSRSSQFPGVSCQCMISPLSLMTKCNLNP